MNLKSGFLKKTYIMTTSTDMTARLEECHTALGEKPPAISGGKAWSSRDEPIPVASPKNMCICVILLGFRCRCVCACVWCTITTEKKKKSLI